MNPSQEQVAIVDAVKQNKNVIVNAVAGAGKTTTTLLICKGVPEKKCLMLTYNTRLRQETRHRVEQQGLDNLVVHTYHSFFFNLVPGCRATTDFELIRFFKNPHFDISFDFDIVIVDEAQDMCDLYFRAIAYIAKVNKKKIQFVVCGDPSQSIYQYNGADERYIVFADKIFGNHFEWVTCTLSTSFRITNHMAQFVNRVLYKGHFKMNAPKKGAVKPKYIVCDAYGNRPLLEIENLLQHYDPSDIFIIAPSIRSRGSPCRVLANTLSKRGIGVYVPMNDDERLDSDILKGKLVFSSFHQVKGLERKVVIVLGFDNSYFEIYKKDYDDIVCPNELYVACTRATERLVMIHHSKFEKLSFIDQALLEQCVDLEMRPIVCSEKQEDEIQEEKVRPSSGLVRHLPSELVYNLLQNVQVKSLRPIGELYHIPTKISQPNGSAEPVMDIGLSVIKTFFEITRSGSAFVLRYLKARDIKIPERMTIHKLAYLCNLYLCKVSGYVFRKYQISNFGWIKKSIVDIGVARLEQLLSQTADLNVVVSHDSLQTVLFAIDNGTVYSLAFGPQIPHEAILDTVVNMYIVQNHNVLKTVVKRFCIFNLHTGEVVQVKCDCAHEIVASLRSPRTLNIKTNQEFIDHSKSLSLSFC